MRWTVAALVGACAGGVVWAVRRRTRQPADQSEWAAATDTVTPARG
ncbi:hypothetical protein [Microlunatus flavus]|uniref:Uncharacterized protein n=1 Tax=Microlunatus flavus TaxID=1036181 RepID=A0A1H9ANT6_9ACTN|nr:hypothetical protein [Microlunatus flavus]SEP78434.1 hypothetical protein SAMN05421756_101678 [Microlunatus flavus]